jgi:hypothetical protein
MTTVINNNKKHTDDGDAKPLIADEESKPRQPAPSIKVHVPSNQGGGENIALVNEINWQCGELHLRRLRRAPVTALSLIYWRRPLLTFIVASSILLSLSVRPLTIVCSLMLAFVSFALVIRSLQSASELTARI